MYRKLVPCVRAQAGVSDGGLQDSRIERGAIGGLLAAYIPKWLVDSRVLGHIGGEKDQAQDNNEEWQQIEAGELQHRDREKDLKPENCFSTLLLYAVSNAIL